MMDRRTGVRVRRALADLVDAGFRVEAFCAAAGGLVSRAVPSAAGASVLPTWYALDPGSLLISGVYGPDCTLDSAAQMRWEYLDDDVNKSVDVTRNPAGVQTLSEVTGGNPWRSAIYRDYMHDHDLAQEMVVALRGLDGQVRATVRLNRPRAMVEFDDADAHFMRSIAPLLAEGVRRGLLADAGPASPVPAAPGLVVVDRTGRPLAMSPGVPGWLALFPGSPAPEGGLPQPVHAVSFAALAGNGPAPLLHVRLKNGHWAVLHGLPLEPGAAGAVSVIIDAAGHGNAASLAAALYGLTVRERQVAELVLKGQSTQRIAHGLGISPFTAQEHLRHIYAKTGAAGRGELVATLFLD